MDEAPAPWTVTTWNVHGSAGPAIVDLAAAIRPETPDIVVVQEIRHGQARRLAAALGMDHTWALKHYPYTVVVWWRGEGMAILSRHGLTSSGHARISDSSSKQSWRRRIAQWALVERTDGSTVRIHNVHLSPHDDPSARRGEAFRVARIVADHRAEVPAVVAGDFNDATDATIVFALGGVEHVTPSFTNPSMAPSQVLDHVLLPPDAADVAVTVAAGGPEWAAISDHLPVTVRFRLPG